MKKNQRSSQLYFYCIPEEIDKLVHFILQQDAEILSDRSESPEPYILMNRSSIKTKVYACPKRLINEIHLNKITDEQYFVDFSISPVIEISMSIDRGGSLSRGRLYIQFGYDGREGWFSYHESLAQLYKKIVQFLKKYILLREKCFGAYCSKGVLEFQRSGGELVQF